MSMSPENYNGLENRSIQLINNIQNILNDKSEDVELKAATVYDEIIALERELNIAIKNLKMSDKIEKYQAYLNSILLQKQNVYIIAHIM